MLDWIVSNIWILLFYAFIIFLIYVNREKFDFPAKFIAMYRTRAGLKIMDSIAIKFRESIKILGYIGVGVGFIGMLLIIGMLVMTLTSLIISPQTTQGVTLVLPGVRMPNSIFIPFVQGILSIFIIATMHEMAHGIVARAWRIPILSSGIVFFGPIIGAFVEPDEKRMERKLDIEKYSVFAAGPFVNIAFAVIFLLILSLAVPHISGALYQGVQIVKIEDNSPAMHAQLSINDTILYIEDYEINNVNDLNVAMKDIKPNSTLSFTVLTQKGKKIDKSITTGNNNGMSYLGVLIANSEKYKHGTGKTITSIVQWLMELFSWLINLSLAIGLINLLPLGPTDGGRMMHLATKSVFKEKGEKIYYHISFLSLMLLLASLVLSYAKPLFM